ncbi:hypothetical protein MLD38_009219 [Melastoma candidum]|uniref:Uncharacterized protein n=1 Tax=Melastoma candidum TaxID=119954 RepID=A0ACB9S0J0_9MYRT|nr:hypothetical protein MLD38_009219 [Melastoma candidum]
MRKIQVVFDNLFLLNLIELSLGCEVCARWKSTVFGAEHKVRVMLVSTFSGDLATYLSYLMQQKTSCGLPETLWSYSLINVHPHSIFLWMGWKMHASYIVTSVLLTGGSTLLLSCAK